MTLRIIDADDVATNQRGHFTELTQIVRLRLPQHTVHKRLASNSAMPDVKKSRIGPVTANYFPYQPREGDAGEAEFSNPLLHLQTPSISLICEKSRALTQLGFFHARSEHLNQL